MAITLSFTDDEYNAIEAVAKSEGESVESWIRKTILRVASVPSEDTRPNLSAEEWEREFDAFLDSLPEMPSLSDEAISRESIYTREDEWNR